MGANYYPLLALTLGEEQAQLVITVLRITQEQAVNAKDRDTCYIPTIGHNKHKAKISCPSKHVYYGKEAKLKQWRKQHDHHNTHKGCLHHTCEYCFPPYNRAAMKQETQLLAEEAFTNDADLLAEIAKAKKWAYEECYCHFTRQPFPNLLAKAKYHTFRDHCYTYWEEMPNSPSLAYLFNQMVDEYTKALWFVNHA